jgi:N-acetyl-gamma-glutamyl-phosphate reductase
MPHVAPHFRGITMTVNMWLREPLKADWIRARYEQRYAGEPLVRVVEEAPWVSRIAGRHGVEIGGFTVSADGKRLVVVSTEDNLLKGAATQAMQNINIALGLPEMASIPAFKEVAHG